MRAVCMLSTCFLLLLLLLLLMCHGICIPMLHRVCGPCEWNINARFSFSTFSRNDSLGSLTHHLLFQHHLHGQQSQPQQRQQPAGGRHHREPGQQGRAPDHGGLLLSPQSAPTSHSPIVTYVPSPRLSNFLSLSS